MADLGMAIVDVLKACVMLFFVLFGVVIAARVSIDYYFQRKRQMLHELGMKPCKEGSHG